MTADDKPSPFRVLVATIIPLLGAFAIATPLGGARWSLFYPAVFASALFGGFASGITATLASTALMWWYLVPPAHAILKPNASNYLMASIFIVSGSLISAVLEWMRRRTAELTANQRFLQGILDYSPYVIVIKDLNGRYLIVNKAFEGLTGITAEAALQHTDLELFPTTLAEDFRAKDKVVSETRKPLLFEERFDIGKGYTFLVSEFPLLDSWKRVFAIGAIAKDISERKRSEQELHETLEDLRAAEHVAHVGSWRWDFQTNRSKWSDELYRMFGIDPHQQAVPLVNPGIKLLTPESLEELRAAMDKIRMDGEPFELDLEFIRHDGSTADGSTRWCAARGEPIRSAAGQVIGINGTVADITHIKELERLREEWTSAIAHDLRQPIGIISMASDVLPEMHAAGSDEQAMLQRIQSASHSLKRMVDDLLDLSLLEAHRLKLERTWIDPHVMVRDAVGQLWHLAGDRVKIHESGPPTPIYVDRMRIEQVLGNLLSNAVKYGDAKAAIDVQLECSDREVMISVSNCGAGIDPNDLPRLFDRFVRSKQGPGLRHAGLGLGLYISKRIVEAHGGRMWVDSVPGKTTTFHFAVPASASQRRAA